MKHAISKTKTTDKQIPKIKKTVQVSNQEKYVTNKTLKSK